MVKPLPRRRARQALDTGRMAQAVSRPGIDPRTWVALGRVIEVGYDNGWVVACTILDGALVNEDVTCDVSASFAHALSMASVPIEVGDVAVIVMPGGEANNMGIVVGFIHAPNTRVANSVNGEDVGLPLAQRAIVVSNSTADVELSFKSVRLSADAVRIGPGNDASQPFVRGQDFVDALDDFLEATESMVGTSTTGLLGAFTTASAVALPPYLAPLLTPFQLAVTALTQWKAAIRVFRSHLVVGDALSAHIKGE
jgi:hypothetical protein